MYGAGPMATKKHATRSDIDWVGGIVSLPGHVTGEGEPYRPELITGRKTKRTAERSARKQGRRGGRLTPR